MCGIAGIIGPSAQESRPRVERMNACMPYRGPNDRGIWAEDRACLGHLRLSIIDTTDAGHQPMLSHDERYVIIFNGEIFNYIELRDELRALGSTFATPGDTEVIIEAYRQWGEQCVRKFNGMWAFAIWDRTEKTLFASRDRFGVKPFFYTFEDGTLCFASEMKALLENGKGEADWEYFYHFFDRKTPLGSDRTVFHNIRHLRPGHSLIWEKGVMTIMRFWEPDPAYSRATYDYRDPVASFRNLMMDAVKLRLRSDVPLGVCLSGGVDSSVIAVAMNALGIKPTTFSIVYDEAAYSEKQYMDAVNASIGATSYMHTPRSGDFFPTLDQIVMHHDEPVRMPGCFSHHHVMRCASDHVTVVLDGQGADEVFGGYREYFPAYLASLFRDALTLQHPIDALKQASDCLGGIGEHLGGTSSYMQEALLKTVPEALRNAVRKEASKQALFSDRFVETYARPLPDDPDEHAFLNRYSSVLDREMRKTFVETNLPMLLRYEDRNSMAFSLEARVPFLDYRVVEFAQGLPYRMKMRGYTTKWIVREAFKDLLPDEVLNRKDKKGFPTPASLWFRGPLKEEVSSRIRNGAYFDRDLFDRDQVIKCLDEHMSGKKDHERTLFRLLTLDIWLRNYLAS